MQIFSNYVNKDLDVFGLHSSNMAVGREGIYRTMVFNSVRDGIYVAKVRVKLGDLCDVRDV
jgi:hypothetical protein